MPTGAIGTTAAPRPLTEEELALLAAEQAQQEVYVYANPTSDAAQGSSPPPAADTGQTTEPVPGGVVYESAPPPEQAAAPAPTPAPAPAPWDVLLPVVNSGVGQAVQGVLNTSLPGSEYLPAPPPTAVGGRIGQGNPEGAVQLVGEVTGAPFRAVSGRQGERAMQGQTPVPTREEIAADPTRLIDVLPGMWNTIGPGSWAAGSDIDTWARANPDPTRSG